MKSLTFLTLITCLLISCKSNSDTHDEGSTTTKQQDAVIQNQEAHNDYSTAVTLNNGQKWNANPETTEGIKKMNSLLESFPEPPKTEDYHSLKSNLEKEFDTILQKCTMTGEAHNQLHNYLVPMKVLIDKLSSNSANEQKETLDNLKKHLKEYYNYFQ